MSTALNTEHTNVPPDSIGPAAMPHVGLSAYRLNPNQGNLRELAFAVQWAEENKHPGPNILAHLIPGYTDRDAQVAATMMQWLGSNVGMSFLEEAIKREPQISHWLRQRALA